MPGDLLRGTERAAIISLKADAPLATLVAEASIQPTDEKPIWPFIRLDGAQAIPSGRGCTARSEVTFLLHAFAKPRYAGDAMTETAQDRAGKITGAIVEAIHGHAFVVDGRRYRFGVRSTRLLQDGAEADAYHGIVSMVARAYQG